MASAKATKSHAVSVCRAKAQLSKLVERAERGEETFITRSGRPIARIAPLRGSARRRLGLLDGRFTIPDDFNDPVAEETMAAFAGKPR